MATTDVLYSGLSTGDQEIFDLQRDALMAAYGVMKAREAAQAEVTRLQAIETTNTTKCIDGIPTAPAGSTAAEVLFDSDGVTITGVRFTHP